MRTTHKRFGGPGALIAAAFIGPGTVTVCTLAGAQYGYQLLWAMVLSVVATIVLQEMAARLGIVTRLDLSSLIRREIAHPVVRGIVLVLILCSIVVGNAAYEAGNISGGALGLATFLPGLPASAPPLLTGALAFVLLWFGSYRVLEKSLVGLVLLMSLSFIFTALITKPNVTELIQGCFHPRIPPGGLLLVMGLVGTTIVPYNLFLHASLAKDRWQEKEEVVGARKDTVSAIALGGIISMAIIVSARTLPADISSAADLAAGLEPVYGVLAKYMLSLGLFAAGITSAITAPLAAAYVAAGCLGWSSHREGRSFRAVWAIILLLGVVFSSLGFRPVDIIRFAQFANGLLLPVIGFLLVWLSGKTSVLGRYKNSPWMTTVGVVMLLLITALGVRSIWTLL